MSRGNKNSIRKNIRERGGETEIKLNWKKNFSGRQTPEENLRKRITLVAGVYQIDWFGDKGLWKLFSQLQQKLTTSECLSI